MELREALKLEGSSKLEETPNMRQAPLIERALKKSRTGRALAQAIGWHESQISHWKSCPLEASRSPPERLSRASGYRGPRKAFNGPAEALRGSKSPACTDRRAAHSSRHFAALHGTPPAWAREPTPFAASAHSPAIDPPQVPPPLARGTWGGSKAWPGKQPGFVRATTHHPPPRPALRAGSEGVQARGSLSTTGENP